MVHHNTHKTSLLVWVKLADTQLITDGVKYPYHGRQSDTIWQPNVIHSETMYPHTQYWLYNSTSAHTLLLCIRRISCWLNYQHARYTCNMCWSHDNQLTTELAGLMTRLRLPIFRNIHNFRFGGGSCSEVGDIGVVGGGALRHSSICLRGWVRINARRYLGERKKIKQNYQQFVVQTPQVACVYYENKARFFYTWWA